MNTPELLNTEKIIEGQELVLQLLIPKDCVFFIGHFPGSPILPGVVQVDWAIDYASQLLGMKKENINEIAQLKFTQVITPGTTLFLSLVWASNKLVFRYFNPECTYSSGKLKVSD